MVYTQGVVAAEQGHRTSVLVVDDHPMYRAGVVDAIKRRPELELVGEAEDGRTALELMRRLSPEVAILDLQLPELDGEQLARAVQRDSLPSRLVFLTAYFDSRTVYACMGAGASGFLSKGASAQEICEAIEAVGRGETVLGREIQASLASEIQRREPSAAAILTEREREVLRLTADGLAAAEIGERLNIGQTTVKTHLQHVYEKLGVSDRAAAVAEAMRRKLLE